MWYTSWALIAFDRILNILKCVLLLFLPAHFFPTPWANNGFFFPSSSLSVAAHSKENRREQTSVVVGSFREIASPPPRDIFCPSFPPLLLYSTYMVCQKRQTHHHQKPKPIFFFSEKFPLISFREYLSPISPGDNGLSPILPDMD